MTSETGMAWMVVVEAVVCVVDWLIVVVKVVVCVPVPFR
ncbi:Uncharacterised protein [uncultured archaeon]|nr:Uncharacterised protein [uncultured archaeon]